MAKFVSSKLIGYDVALGLLETGLSKSSISYTFSEFVSEVFSQSFKDFDFNWHHKVLCEDVEEALSSKMFYAAVLPRYHSKSTILGYAFSVWAMDVFKPCDILYLSYRDGMSAYHIGKIKESIRNNPILSSRYVDLSPQAEASARYEIDGFESRILRGGILTFKRGMHPKVVIVDDPLSDPQNPLNYTQIKKVSTRFKSEIINLPTVDGFMIVMGTTMVKGDLLHELKDIEGFRYRFMPVYNPTDYSPDLQEEYGNIETLWEKKYSREWLESRRGISKKAFSTEFLLTPVLETDAYFTREEIEAVVDSSLKNYSVFTRFADG